MKLVLIIILDMIDISDLAMRYKPLFALNMSCMNAITLLRLFSCCHPNIDIRIYLIQTTDKGRHSAENMYRLRYAHMHNI